MKKLFLVTITHEIVVCAEDKSEAEDYAQDELYDLDEPEIIATDVNPIRPHLDGNFYEHIPYGANFNEDNPDMMVKDILAELKAKTAQVEIPLTK